MKGYKHLTAEQKTTILETYRQTLSTKRCAEASHATIDQVRNLLHKEGIQPSGETGGACYRHIDEVRQWAKEGVSYAEIARRIGSNHHRVSDFLEKHHIEYNRIPQVRDNNPHWRGGRVIDKAGYVLVHQPDHPSANYAGYVREHRLVMEQLLGRYLLPTEVVHHIDNDPQNNHPDNLRLYGSNGDHLAETLQGCVPQWTEEGKARISESTRQQNMQRRKSNRSASVHDAGH